MIKVRSHNYPKRGKYIETTYLDPEENSLDIGYQRLKKIFPQHYVHFNYINKLFIDHNCLTELPPSKLLPNLEYLTCSHNQLGNIPLYPMLTYLDASNNHITNLQQYDGSILEYLNCSCNENFILNFRLPKCKFLSLREINASKIDLRYCRSIEVVDCDNNRIDSILGGDSLLELSAKYNNLSKIPDLLDAKILVLDYNQIKYFQTFQNLTYLSAPFNGTEEIAYQPSLTKLIANDNKIGRLGIMPKIKLVELANNNIKEYKICPGAKHLSLKFNPLYNIDLSAATIKGLRELQINYNTYKHIYNNYYDTFDSMSLTIDKLELKKTLDKISNLLKGNIIDDKLKEYMYEQISAINFMKRDVTMLEITHEVYKRIFEVNKPQSQSTPIEIVSQNEVFKYLHGNVCKIYYQNIVITLFFNNNAPHKYFNSASASASASASGSTSASASAGGTRGSIGGSAKNRSSSSSKGNFVSATQSASRSGSSSTASSGSSSTSSSVSHNKSQNKSSSKSKITFDDTIKSNDTIKSEFGSAFKNNSALSADKNSASMIHARTPSRKDHTINAEAKFKNKFNTKTRGNHDSDHKFRSKNHKTDVTIASVDDVSDKHGSDTDVKLI